jgi:DNA-directed RNA polymerase sigma subunit (sigma70/sigma32)
MKKKPVKKFDDPYSDYDMTKEEIGSLLGVSRQAVTDIEKKALMKLRIVLRNKGIKKEDLI